MPNEKIFCRNCGAEILSSDTYCSKCGTRLESIQEEVKPNKYFLSKNMMWGIIGLLFIGLLCIISIGVTIHNNPNPESLNTTQTNDISTSDPTIAAVGTKEQVDSEIYNFANVIDNKYSQWCCYDYGNKYKIYTAPKGYTYLIALIVVQNKGYSSISTNPYNWKLTTNGVSYTPDTATFGIKQPLSQVEHDGQASFAIIYLVQGNPSTAQLTYMG